jgi:membrane-associated phospholipid phosphatase
VTSPSDSMETSNGKGVASTLSKRIWLVLLVCCIEMIYIPTSSQVRGGIEPKLPIDIFPVWPIWVLPYVLCYLLWVFALVWVILKMEDRLFRAFIVACLLTFAMGVGTFIFFPTYVKAAIIEGNDIFSSLLRFIHQNLGRYDAFPSGHIYITTLLVLFYGRWYPRQKLLWALILIIISLSTLFTRQHYILDVVGGYVVAAAGYHFGLWWAGFYPAQKRTDKRSRKRIASSSFD